MLIAERRSFNVGLCFLMLVAGQVHVHGESHNSADHVEKLVRTAHSANVAKHNSVPAVAYDATGVAVGHHGEVLAKALSAVPGSSPFRSSLLDSNTSRMNTAKVIQKSVETSSELAEVLGGEATVFQGEHERVVHTALLGPSSVLPIAFAFLLIVIFADRLSVKADIIDLHANLWTGALGLIYIVWALALAFTNRHLAQLDSFAFPITLVALQMFTSTLAGCLLLLLGPPESLPVVRGLRTMVDPVARWDLLKAMMGIAVCFAYTLSSENASLRFIPLAFAQMIKEPAIIVLACFNALAQRDTLSWARMGLLSLIGIGGCLLVHGEVHFAWNGFLLMLSSTLVNQMRLCLAGIALSRDANGMSLDALSYMFFVSPLALLALVPASMMEISLSSTSVLNAFVADWPGIVASCLLAAGVNFIIAAWIARTSSIHFCCLGAVKNALCVIGANLVLGETFSVQQLLGIGFIFFAVPAYSWRKQKEVQQLA